MESPEGGEQREIIIQAILVDSVLSFGRIAFGFPSFFCQPMHTQLQRTCSPPAYFAYEHVQMDVCLPYNCKHVFVTITATTMSTETNNTPSDSQVEGIC